MRSSRREFLRSSAAIGAAAAVGCSPIKKQFRVWAFGDAHVGTDLERGGRRSITEAIAHSEFGGEEGGPRFDWDIAINVGDLAGGHGPPGDTQGEEVARQLGSSAKHRREQIYCLAGNHDATKDQRWFRTWVDPIGEHTETSGVDSSRRPYPVTGTWERYTFEVGNLVFVMMSDRNDLPPPVGRGERGGYPAGSVTSETVDWWKDVLDRYRGRNIVCAHHHMLKETTVASGPWEGFRKKEDGSYKGYYHGFTRDGGPMGASYLYWMDDTPDAQAFEKHLAANPGAIDMWIGGHTHSHPDDRKSGRTHIEAKWGATFLNCAALSRHHALSTTLPISRLLIFTEGSRDVRILCYLHDSQHEAQGWYAHAERIVPLKHPFRITV